LNTIAVLCSRDIAVAFMSVFPVAEKQEIVQPEQLTFKDDGVYSFAPYHSTSHEVLGVYHGSAKLRLGGKQSQQSKSGRAM
jgi:uncharacterized protein YjlB